MASKLFPHWDMRTLPEFPIIYIMSCKRSGKTILTTAIYLEFLEENFDLVVVLCGNPHSARAWRLHVPEKYVHSRYRTEVLSDFFRESDRQMRKGKTLPKTAIILDDVLRMRKSDGKSRTMDDANLHRAFQEHRHYNLSLILISQNIACGTSSWCRNSDIFIFAPSSLTNNNDAENICRSYMGYQRNLDINYELLDTFEKYEFLVIRYHTASRKQKDLLRYYKVDKKMVTYITQPSSEEVQPSV